MNRTPFPTARDIVAEEHWTHKGATKLYLFRKFSPAAQLEHPGRPLVFLVHGSSFSSRTTYDLNIPGEGEYSLMNVFASLGYDVWTMDHEGYGRSGRTEGFSFIADGVLDLEAAMALVEAETGVASAGFFGTSSGALRAARFTNEHPERVERLSLAALVWTGEGSPTLAKRAQRIEEWRASNRRVVDEQAYRAIFSRDVTGLTIDALPAVAAAAEMDNGGGSVPNGTYIDMCVNLPQCDPARIPCPVQIFRGDHDGIATDADVMAFFAALPNGEKQLVMTSGQAHNTTLGINRHRFWHSLHSFFGAPARIV